MTREQYERWKEFSLRMARAYPGMPKRGDHTRKWLVESVEWFFDVAVENNYGPDFMGTASRITAWDQTDDDEENKDRYGRASIGPYVCDIVSEMSEHVCPYYWSKSDSQFERWDDVHGAKIRCCVRAGIDLASEPSAGVAGFTMGDLRRMYPEGLPDWIVANFTHIGSPFEPVEKCQPITADEFLAMPDDAGVWL